MTRSGLKNAHLANEHHSYYLYHHHRQQGPFSLYQLADQLNYIKPNTETKIFCIGWNQWIAYDMLGGIQDICAARRNDPTQFQSIAAQKFEQKVHEEQLRRFDQGSFAQFRLSAAPKTVSTDHQFIPIPNHFPFWKVLTISAMCVVGGIVLALLRHTL